MNAPTGPGDLAQLAHTLAAVLNTERQPASISGIHQ